MNRPGSVVLLGFFLAAACTGGGGASDNDSKGGGKNAGTGGSNAGQGGNGTAGTPGGGAGGEPGGQGGSQPQQTGGMAGGAGAGGQSGNTGGSGGTMATGGSSGQTGGTAGTSTPAAECKPPQCDDFEGYNAGSQPGAPWKMEISGGSIAVDETQAFSGKRSAKITVNTSGNKQARMQHGGGGVVPGDDIYMRMMVYMPTAPTGDALHWNWMRVEGAGQAASGNKLSNIQIATGGNASGKLFNLYGGGAVAGGYQDCATSSNMRLPTKAWTCVEFHVNAKTNSGEVWLNGVRDDFTAFDNAKTLPGAGSCLDGHNFTMNQWFVPTVQKAIFGVTMHHTLDATATYWIDDATVSNKRIGCPAK